MKERIKKVEQVLQKILLERECPLNIANWLEVELDELFPFDCAIQDFVTELALYQPRGGEFLINEEELIKRCESILSYIVEINRL